MEKIKMLFQRNHTPQNGFRAFLFLLYPFIIFLIYANIVIMEILTPFTGEMLVLAMLVVLNGRIFFTRHTRHDAIALFAPFSLFIMVLGLFAWGVRFTGLVIFALTFISTILNYRSIVRFSQKLFVDSYTLKFFIGSLLVLLVVLFVLVVNVLMRPVRLQTYRYNVKVERDYYSCPIGFVSGELKKSLGISDKRNMTLYTFSNKNKDAQKDMLILFLPDVQAETLNYEPYLILMARAGYTVIAADLYDNKVNKLEDLKKTKFLRRFSLLQNAFKNGSIKGDQAKTALATRTNDFAQIYELSYNALAYIAKTEYPEKGIFIVSDSSAVLPTEKIDAIFANYFTAPDMRAMPRLLDLASIKEYSTPCLGFVAQTNPIFAKLFLGIEREKASFVPSYCVLQTRQRIGD